MFKEGIHSNKLRDTVVSLHFFWEHFHIHERPAFITQWKVSILHYPITFCFFKSIAWKFECHCIILNKIDSLIRKATNDLCLDLAKSLKGKGAF